MKKILTVLLLCGIFCSLMINVNAAIGDGLIMYYDFSDGVKDVSGKNNSGTIVGEASVSDTDVGKALVFDGSTGYIDCSNISLTGITKFTISFWSKAVDLGSSFSSILSSNGWSLEGDTHIIFADGMYYQFSVNGVSDMKFLTHTVELDTWEHVTMTYDTTAGIVALYINGEFTEEIQASYLPELYIDGFAIGSWKTNDGAYDRFYNGSFGNFRLYDRVLSASEVKELAALKGEAEAEIVEESTPTAEVPAVTIDETPAKPLISAPQTNDIITIFIAIMLLSGIILGKNLKLKSK